MTIRKCIDLKPLRPDGLFGRHAAIDLPTHLYYQLVYTLTDLLPPLDDGPVAPPPRPYPIDRSR